MACALHEAAVRVRVYLDLIPGWVELGPAPPPFTAASYADPQVNGV